MFGNAFGWPHLLIILVILLLLFGAPKLPALAKSIAQSMKIFRTEMGGNATGGSANGGATPPSAQNPNGTGGTLNGQPYTSDDNGTTPPSTDYPPKV